MRRSEKKDKKEMSDEEKVRKIQSLREMIDSAEKTIQSAKAMLLQFEGKKKTGRKRKFESDEEGTIVHGTFDGQIMIGADGKQYPVPANYASKSKLVEGDMLKLTITPDGSFIYKQIGPAERKHALGIVNQDEKGNYYIIADGKSYSVLLASVTYFKATPGDEVAIVIPRDIESSWAAIENVLQKARDNNQLYSQKFGIDKEVELWKEEFKGKQKEESDNQTNKAGEVADEWFSDIEEIEKEVSKKK